MLVQNRRTPVVCVPLRYQDVDIGEEAPVRCLQAGLWLLDRDGCRLALVLQPSLDRQYLSIQIAAANDEAGSRVTRDAFRRIEETVAQAPSYRGKVLSLEWQAHYTGVGSGITVHKIRPVRREDVILPRQALELLERNVIRFVRERSRLAELGMAARKGVLFYGPPGTGKTHTLHYLIGELKGITTLLITAEQMMLLGEYMTLARLLQPSMVVIEDADLIARSRTVKGMTGGAEVVLNQLLNEMDGLREDADILFILTTNRPKVLEPALTSRPGRIDQAIEFPYPDDEGRARLIRLYARGAVVAEEVVRTTVQRTEKVSAAFIKELMRRAAQFQLERGADDGITVGDVDNALDEMLARGGSLNRKLLGCGAIGFGSQSQDDQE
jgi:AAA+ superfamily predicted ATPase